MTVRDLTDDERRAVHNALHNSVVLVEDPEVIALRARVAELEAALPKEPPLGLLMSMAMRMDHGLGMPGYYGEMHERRLDAALTTCRQLYEEISGQGFYRAERESEYASAVTKAREKQP